MYITGLDIKLCIGAILKRKVLKKKSIQEISSWAYSLYLEGVAGNDEDVNSALMSLGGMDCGQEGEFEYSYERLSEIADELIAGDKINLNY